MIVPFLLLALACYVAFRKYNQPDKPWLGCVADTVLLPLFWLRLGPFANELTIQHVMRRAMKETKLSDFGATSDFIKRYELALSPRALFGAGCRFSPFGRMLAEGSTLQQFIRKLRFIDFLKKHPSVLQVPCEKPIFVVGLTRTGTTLLHRLSIHHPAVRCHYTWEQMNFIPKVDTEDVQQLLKDREDRYPETHKRLEFAFRLTGDFFRRIHEIGADEPEECTVPLGLDLPFSLLTLGTLIFIDEALVEMGAVDAYRRYKQYLQLLSWQIGEREEPRRWFLKCPFHPMYMDALADVFPDATIVWTHRDPAESVVSTCSLNEALLKHFMEHETIDRKIVGQKTLEYAVRQMRRAAEQIEQKGLKLINVYYSEITKDPKNTVLRLYEQLGIQSNPEFEKSMDDWLDENARRRKEMSAGGKQALHAYKAEDYGLTNAGIREAMKDYIERFNVPLNPKLK